jgi:plasmid stabilization system protein ParE
MAQVIITEPAKRDIQAAHDWWAENRSVDQARRWYIGIRAAVRSLRHNPERCSLATESDLLAEGIRQLNFGLGGRATHRIVFATEHNSVVVLRVRHVSQDALSAADIGQES